MNLYGTGSARLGLKEKLLLAHNHTIKNNFSWEGILYKKEIMINNIATNIYIEYEYEVECNMIKLFFSFKNRQCSFRKAYALIKPTTWRLKMCFGDLKRKGSIFLILPSDRYKDSFSFQVNILKKKILYSVNGEKPNWIFPTSESTR